MGLCLLVSCPAYAAHTHDSDSDQKTTKFTKHFNESLFTITEKGEFSIEILMDEKEYKIGKDVIGIVIHNARDEDVEGADLAVTARTPDGQAISGSPVVKEKGDGLYTVSNLDLKREGRWELRVAVKKKSIEDSALFVFPDVTKEHIPAGKYDARGSGKKSFPAE